MAANIDLHSGRGPIKLATVEESPGIHVLRASALVTTSGIDVHSGQGPVKLATVEETPGVHVLRVAVDAAAGGAPFPTSQYTPYVPTVAFTGGSGVSVSGGVQAYLLVGKVLFIHVNFAIAFTTAPLTMTVSLPPGLLANGQNQLAAANSSLQVPVYAGAANGSNLVAVNVASFTATGSTFGMGGIINIQ